MNDWQLLRDYADRGSEAAFRELVNRHLNLVHAAALRQVNDPEFAAEISQAVFILLARKARSLKQGIVLSGWLFRTTRFVAARAVRAEHRRRRREQEALEMQQLATRDPVWSRIAPALDEAMDNLSEKDRNAVLLRYFEDRNHREVGTALGVNEEAARKRVDRALEKLRRFFANRGVTLPGAALASLLAANAVQAAPAGLCAGIGTLAISSGTATAAALPSLVREVLSVWRWTKLKWVASFATLGILSVAVVLSVILQKRGPLPAAQNQPTVLRAATSQTAQHGSASRPAQPLRSGAGILHFHVIAKDTGEPIANAQLALKTETEEGWKQRFDLVTDETGSADVAYPTDARQIHVGLVSWGWAARFVTWAPSRDDPVPADYTLRVDGVTNSIGGWLRDEKGQPVAGADVRAMLGSNGDLTGRETPRERSGFLGYVPIARSDRDGFWTAAVVPTGDQVAYRLLAWQPDFAPTGIASWDPDLAKYDSNSAETARQLRLLWSRRLVTTVERGATLAGRVLDDAGNPIAGARLTHEPLAYEEGTITATTDAAGRFSVAKLPGIYFDFAMSAPGFAPEYREVWSNAMAAPLEIRLKPGARLRLRLVDEQGAPVAGATVGLEKWRQRPRILRWQAESDAEGRIEWDSAPSDGELELCAFKADWCYTRNIVLKADGTEHEIKMCRALTVTGRVTDASTGQPVDHVKACPAYGDDNFILERLDMRHTTGGDYLARFDENRLPWRVRVEADGYAPFTSEPLPPNFSGALDVVLRRSDASNSVHGVVLGPDGRPAAGVEVALLTLDYHVVLDGLHFKNFSNPGLIKRTDATGQFAFDADPRAHSVVAAGPDGFARLRIRDFSKAVTVELRPWGRIAGVIDPSVEKNSYNVAVLEDLSAFNYPGSLTLGRRQVKPDANGNFNFDCVPPETFCVWLTIRLDHPSHHHTAVTVPPGDTANVTIRDKAGSPVRGRLVSPAEILIDWSNAIALAEVSRVNSFSGPPADLTGDAAAFWWADYWNSETIRMLVIQYDRYRNIRAILSSDGSFEVEEPLPPGDYQFTAVFKSSFPSVRKTFSVPAPAAELAPRVDIGAIPVGTSRDAVAR